MKYSKTLLLAALVLGAFMVTSLIAAPLGTAFTYQGRLDQNNQPALNGIYQMTYWLYAASSGGNPLASNTVPTIPVTNGLFAADVNFGAAWFTGDERWLAITVRTNNGVLPFALLSPRTRLAPTPNAIYASTAGTATNVASGTVVQSLNGLRDAVSLVAGANITLTPTGNSLTVASTGGPGVWSLNGSSAYYNGGNVGIGTATPGALLHVNSSATGSSVLAAMLEPSLANGGFNQIYLGRTPTGDGCSTFTYTYDETTPANSFLSLGLYNSSFTFNMRGDGNVGIGTTTPTQKLHVQGNLQAAGDIFAGRNLIFASGASEAELGELLVRNVTTSVGGVLLQSAPRLIVKQNGHVGIGVANPVAALETHGNWDAGTPALQLGGQKPSLVFAGDGASGNRSWLMHVGANGPGNLEFYNQVGSGGWRPMLSLAQNRSFLRVEGAGGEQAYIGGDGIGNDVQVGSLNPSITDIFMYNAGNGTLMHTHVGVLTIHGGADLAEPFPVKEEEIEKGSVVVIDEVHPGHLKRSTRAYDTRVAGIVSGANGIQPGISLKQEGALDQGQNVALSGRVYVQADASHGAINPGDLLTTSDTPGHAMKVLDHAKSQGAILGKAMSSLNEGTGLVLVLVTLQ